MRRSLSAIVFCAFSCVALNASGEDLPTSVTVTLKDHKFDPAAITVPSGQKIRIELRNEDSTAEEFDSDDLHAEKDVKPHGKVSFQVGPLKPGVYHFMGELHSQTAQGTVTAVAPQ